MLAPHVALYLIDPDLHLHARADKDRSDLISERQTALSKESPSEDRGGLEAEQMTFSRNMFGYISFAPCRCLEYVPNHYDNLVIA